MDIPDCPAPPARPLRALLLTALAVGGGVVTWRLRPGTSPATAAPDADVVLGATWLAWVLAGYLCVAVAATSIGRLAARLGVAGQSLANIAPARLRRLVDLTLTVGVAASLAVGPAVGAASAAVPHAETSRIVTGSPLDWPGLGPTQPVSVPHHHHHRAPPSVAGPDVEVVQPGDTLWAIAARRLGPGASGTAITAAWHAWYAANRSVIGPNPSVIHVGQHLVAPTATPDR